MQNLTLVVIYYSAMTSSGLIYTCNFFKFSFFSPKLITHFLVHFIPDLWFWACKVATQTMDSPQCTKIWRHIWVCKPNYDLKAAKVLSSLMFSLPLQWQLFCSWILHEWHSRWENWCFFLWGSTLGAYNRASSFGSVTAKPCDLGNFLFFMIFHYLLSLYFMR